MNVRQPKIGPQINTTFVGGPLVTPRRYRSLYRSRIKRMLDVVFVLLVLPPVAVIMLFLVLMVSLDGGKPFYWQTRIGKHGRHFRMLKLRTMVRDADSALQSYLEQNPDAKEEWDKTQKLRYDPRVTRSGRVLRKTSLDELPQLWNVLTGDMSLVGPRPMMVNQSSLYPGTAYYLLRPGITGPWQVSARNETEFAERAVYDTRYLQAMSFPHDTGIVLKTFRVVIRGTGV